jgi:hypothetical protein
MNLGNQSGRREVSFLVNALLDDARARAGFQQAYPQTL